MNGKFSKEEFIKELTDNLPEPPSYFPSIVKMNQDGYDDIAEILKRSHQKLSVKQFKEKVSSKDVIILDTRNTEKFCEAHIPGSLFIGLSGSFAPWVGMLVKTVEQTIVLVCEEGKEDESILRLSRVGYDNCIGFLDGGMNSWIKSGNPVEKIESKTPSEIQDTISEIELIDVRRPGEYNSEHIEGIDNIPLDTIFNSIDKYKAGKTYHLHCQSGYRSVIAASILKANGIGSVVNIVGGIKLIKESTNFNYVTNACSSEA
jgi:rhodanese-related sulfurtransferase